jgi:hypothetical protein
MRLRSFAFCLATASVSLFLTGCDECSGVVCDGCSGVAIDIYVIDATSRMSIADATVLADGKPCESNSVQGPGHYACDGGIGAHTVEISAPGHASNTITVTLKDDEGDGCCSCPPETSAIADLDPAMP